MVDAKTNERKWNLDQLDRLKEAVSRLKKIAAHNVKIAAETGFEDDDE